MKVSRTIAAGLIASMVMGMIEMIYEAVAGDGFWSPLIYIGATVLRGLQGLRPPVGFILWGVVLGLMGHMMNSVILAWIFTRLLARGAGSRSALVSRGVAYGLVVLVVMWYVVLPVVDPVMLNLTAPVFVLAHLMWGAALGLLLPVPAEAVSRPATA